MLEGYAGVLYPRGVVDLEMLASFASAPAEARFCDDVWISGHLAARRVPRLVSPPPT